MGEPMGIRRAPMPVLSWRALWALMTPWQETDVSISEFLLFAKECKLPQMGFSFTKAYAQLSTQPYSDSRPC